MDLTKGNILSLLIKFSLPMMLSAILQQLYSWADAFIVGNLDGELALAAVGSTTNIVGFIVFAITGFTGGLTIISAQFFGQGDLVKSKQLLSTYISIFSIVFIIASIVLFFYTDQVLMLFKVPEDIFEMSKDYMQIYLLGLPFICIYNIYASILRGIGDSKLPFIAVIISSILNIILDIIFIGPLQMSTSGAALATTISQIVMMLYVFIAGNKKHVVLHFKKGDKLIHLDVFKKGLAVGTPLMIQSSIIAAGSIVLQGFINGFGTPVIAGITTAYRVDSIMLTPIINLSMGLTTLIAQNVGAGNPVRAYKGLVHGTLFIGIVSVVSGFLVMFFGEYVIAIFGLSDTALQVGKEFFLYLGPFYFLYGLSCSLRGYLEAHGKVFITCIITISGLCVRVISSYSLEHIFDYNTIALAEGISWAANLLLVCIYLTIFMLKNKKQIQQEI